MLEYVVYVLLAGLCAGVLSILLEQIGGLI